MARVIGVFARKESEDKSRRVARQKEQAAKEGRANNGGHRPYGFTATRHRLVPKEAAIIREMARRVLAGQTLFSIAVRLNKRKVPTANGIAYWSPSTIRRIVVAPRKSGQVEHRGTIVAKGDWPAILTVTQTAQLRKILLDVSRKKKYQPRVYPLTGLLRCGRCGTKLMARYRREGLRHYGCLARPGTPTACGRIVVVAYPLEALVAKRVLSLDSISEAQRREWPDMTATRRKRFLAGLIESIVIHPTGPSCRFDPSRVQIVMRDEKHG